jgi:hypothetical protein
MTYAPDDYALESSVEASAAELYGTGIDWGRSTSTSPCQMTV